jgi:hypothetical protein
MSSLRRQVMDHRKKVESSKTMSRKAKARLEAGVASPLLSAQNSRPTSRADSNRGSPPGSRQGSLPNSRHGSRAPSPTGSPGRWNLSSNAASEDSDDSLDHTDLPTVGIDHLVEAMTDREFLKGSSETRAQILRAYANSLCQSTVEDKESEIEEVIPILIRCLGKDSGDGAKQALRAIAATAVICQGLTNLFSLVREQVYATIFESEDTEVKVTAIHAYGAVAYFGGADSQQVSSAMNLFINIAQSDGEYIDALDNADIVAAAIEEWSFLSTLVEADDVKFNEALEAFEDQLNSSSPEVLLASADSIGLLCEQQYEPKELDEWDSPVDSAKLKSEDQAGSSEYNSEIHLPRKYQKWSWEQHHDFFQGEENHVKAKLREISTSSMRRTRKDIRKELHNTFRDVLHTVENPWRGPRFSTVLSDEEKTKMLGHRLVKSNILIDRWWKLHRYNAIKRILQGGLQYHIEDNRNIMEALSDSMVAPSRLKKIAEHDGEEELVQQNVPEYPGDDDGEKELVRGVRNLRVS